MLLGSIRITMLFCLTIFISYNSFTFANADDGGASESNDLYGAQPETSNDNFVEDSISNTIDERLSDGIFNQTTQILQQNEEFCGTWIRLYIPNPFCLSKAAAAHTLCQGEAAIRKTNRDLLCAEELTFPLLPGQTSKEQRLKDCLKNSVNQYLGDSGDCLEKYKNAINNC